MRHLFWPIGKNMKKLLNLPLFFALLGASLLLWHHLVQPLTLSIYQPQQILKLSLNASFEPQDDETNIYKFIPSTTFRQSIVDEEFGNKQLRRAARDMRAVS